MESIDVHRSVDGTILLLLLIYAQLDEHIWKEI